MNYEQWTGLKIYTKNYPIREKRKKLFLNFLKKQPKGKVLDVGFYPGDITKEIKDLGHDAYGVDAAKENIANAKKKYPGITFKLANLEKGLPFKDNFFDIIWAGDIIEHVRDTIKVFTEFNRVLKKNGVLVLSTPYHGKLKMIIITLIDLKRHFHPEHRHIRFYTNKALRQLLKKYGFKIEKEFYLGRIKSLANNMLFISKKVKNLNLKEIPEMIY